MFLRATADTAEEIQKAWAHFEAAVGLRGRKFFGAFDISSREYRVCTELIVDDHPEALGFERATLPGGAYLRARRHGEPPAVHGQIPAVFNELVRRGTPDPSRPSIDFYRS